MKTNKITNFWIRLLSRIIDFSIFVVFSILIAWFCLDKNPLEFKEPYKFYIWSISSMAILFTLFILIPFVFKGKTIGMFIVKIKIVFDSKKVFTSIIKRESVFSLLWLMSLLLITAVINHTLINKFAKTDQTNIEYSTWENFRRAIFISIFSFSIILQFVCIVSVIVKKNKVGFHDQFSQTKTVWVNKFDIIKKEKRRISFKPHLVEKQNIIWKEE